MQVSALDFRTFNMKYTHTHTMWQVLYFTNELSVPCLSVELHVLDVAKATMYLPKVVAASHFSLIVVVRSLAHLLPCRALTVAVMCCM